MTFSSSLFGFNFISFVLCFCFNRMRNGFEMVDIRNTNVDATQIDLIILILAGFECWKCFKCIRPTRSWSFVTRNNGSNGLRQFWQLWIYHLLLNFRQWSEYSWLWMDKRVKAICLVEGHSPHYWSSLLLIRSILYTCVNDSFSTVSESGLIVFQ